ncbi:MAG: GLUG motif-containing protein [Candidatus Muiribacteriota bacterium]
MFFGKFDGNGQTISNLYINRPGEDFIGLFGAIGNSTKNISNVFLSNINLTGQNKVGGLCGASIGVISKVGVSGNITSVNDVGGVVGRLGAEVDSGSLDNAFSSVDIYSTGTTHIGGLVGYTYDSNITNCYSVGEITGTSIDQLKGLVGSISSSPIISNCFWDTQTSGQATTASDKGTGKTTADMKTEATFTDAGWDFGSIWVIDGTGTINNGYPYLQ